MTAKTIRQIEHSRTDLKIDPDHDNSPSATDRVSTTMLSD
jgi:hypothetical protein